MITVYQKPSRAEWVKLCKRPEIEKDLLTKRVKEIIEYVKSSGDTALFKLAKLFDGVDLTDLAVSDAEIDEAEKLITTELKDAIALAKRNIEKFHRNQLMEDIPIETSAGVTCWRRSVPIETVGLYIPGGSAPLFSTILMLAIPASIAGCKEIVLCTPPDRSGKIHPAILYTANLVGVRKIFKVGGAQAIAAMANGTETIPKVYKIFGPGNQYVTMAKSIVQQDGVAIDMPAGPSEVLIIADETCNPAFVAADLLSQAEHGADSQVVLLSNSDLVIQKILEELAIQIVQLPRKETCLEALKNSFAVVFNDTQECITFSNYYAPEHLIIATKNATELSMDVVNAGSVFLGSYSCESAGDYASGTNHTLPTNGFAKSYSGVSVDSFVKKITFQNVTSEGIRSIGPAIELMADAEQLDAHKNAVTIRLKSIKNV